MLFENPWHKVTGALNPKWPPLTRFLSITLDLEGLEKTALTSTFLRAYMAEPEVSVSPRILILKT